MIFTFILTCLFSSFSYSANIINTQADFTEALTSKNWEAFEAKYLFIFDSVIYQKQNADWEKRQEQKRAYFFEVLPQIQDGMFELLSNATAIVTEKEKLFKTLFPDLDNTIPVYLIPSMFTFNGKVLFLPEHNRKGLLIGIDYIVKRNDNLDVLFSHEFFHAHHFSKMVPGSYNKTMASPLWNEGFATYISGLLNPKENDRVLLMDEKLAIECEKPEYVKSLAEEYSKIITTDGQTTYEDWFMMSGPTLPKRRGYCLGLKIVRQIAKSHQLTSMITWSEEKFTEEILKVIQSL